MEWCTTESGERMDVVVRAAEESGGYWVRAQGSAACAGVSAAAMFLYSGFNYTAMLDGQKHSDLPTDNAAAVSGQTLKSLQDVTHVPEVKSVYLGIDKNIIQIKDSDNDFRYISDALPTKPFFPASLSLRDSGVVQINNKSFLYPSAPILLKPKDKREPSCLVGEEQLVNDLQCLQVLNAQEGELIELALVNEGFGSNESYTFHIHGYGMQVIATGKNTDDAPLSKVKFQSLDKEGKIIRNLQNPPTKDTITVPNKGYAVVRIRPDHGGSWLLECRACGLSSLPTAIVIRVPQSIPRAVIDSLPKCGSYKPPDVLLN
uniref:Plastocyanin-like domain-containing protein n=1 Tax=Pectinophora gossypiella TaxID=13191 RepID=A0A1E1WDK1_PECGO